MLLKPHQQEGRVTLTDKQRAAKREELFIAQSGICAEKECGQSMIWEPGFMNSASLDHITPQPAGCKKDDRDENLRIICWSCNSKKGSKRIS